MIVKFCRKCEKEKETKEFYRSKRANDGLSCWCKKCEAARMKVYVKNNKEKVAQKGKEWRNGFIEKHGGAVAYKRWQEKYKKSEKGKAVDKKWREKNANKLRKRRMDYYYSKEGQSYQQRYYNENYEEFLRRNEERRARVKSAKQDGSVTTKALRRKLEDQNFKCVLCELDLRIIGKHADHVIPLAKGGDHTINNIQYLCPSCNLSKQDKILCKQ
jgi:5-methylcytosine-specific restriction endonuclease McrA